MTELGQQPNNQTNILKDTETDKHLGRKIHIYKQTHKQTNRGHTHTES